MNKNKKAIEMDEKTESNQLNQRRNPKSLSSDSTDSSVVNSESNTKYNLGWSHLLDLFVYVFFLRVISLNKKSFYLLLSWLLSSRCLLILLTSVLFVLRYILAFPVSRIYKSLSVRILYLLVSHVILSYTIYHIRTPFLVNLTFYSVVFFSEMKMFSFFTDLSDKRPFLDYFMMLLSPVLVFKDFKRVDRKRNWSKIVFCSLNSFVGGYVLYYFSTNVMIQLLQRFVEQKSFVNRINDFLFCTFPTMITFLVFFRTVFIHFFGLLKEISLFSGESFEDWWNSDTSAEFWKKWNLYTHMFIKTYIYKPMRTRKYGFFISCTCSFLYSGLFHEYVLSIALKKFNGIFLIAMLIQVPFHYLTELMEKKFPSNANSIFWIIFSILGQTVGLIAIYYNYVK